MADPGDLLPVEDEPPAKQMPWGIVAGVVIFIGLAVLVFWMVREKSQEAQRNAAIEVLDKELDSDIAALNAQREKVTELTHQVENLRSAIQSGIVSNKKASVTEFNNLL